METGKVVEIIGAVIDVQFPRESMPNIFDALLIEDGDLTLEVQQQIGDGIVRTIAMGTTDGLKRGLDVKSFELEDVVHTGKTYSQQVVIKQGIEQDMAKKVVKTIKDAKLKVQSAIQGDEVRVTGKKRDDLQQAMQLIRTADLGQPFQFKNFRD